MKVALVINIPAPYRIPTWNSVAEQLGDKFLVIFCSKSEPHRNWDVPPMHFQHLFLREKFTGLTNRSNSNHIHNNFNVWKELKRFQPNVVLTGGFNPTMLYAFAYCRRYKIKHIPVTDAWEMSERNLSFVHRFIRKYVYKRSHAFLPCSKKGKKYFQSYGIPPEKIFISHYAIDKTSFNKGKEFEKREYDILFSGQFVPRKNPMFFIDIAKKLHDQFPNLKVLLLGDGPMKVEILGELDKSSIHYKYGGFATQKELPSHYSNSKVFLFPTEFDAWGVVAEEAMAAGTPVITTENAGCSGELVIDGLNGHVIPLTDQAKWLQVITQLLQDPHRWKQYSKEAVLASYKVNAENSAQAITEACTFAFNSN